VLTTRSHIVVRLVPVPNATSVTGARGAINIGCLQLLGYQIQMNYTVDFCRSKIFLLEVSTSASRARAISSNYC
jgi:hypothetical protein